MKKTFKDLPDDIYYCKRFMDYIPNNYLKMHGYVMERKGSFGLYGRVPVPFRDVVK